MFKSISADAQPTSVSGQLAAKVRAELNSVPLPDAYDGKFQDCFFPKKGQPRAQFTYFGQQVARTQARLRLYFNLLTQLMRNSPQIQQAAVLQSQRFDGIYGSLICVAADLAAFIFISIEKTAVAIIINRLPGCSVTYG